MSEEIKIGTKISDDNPRTNGQEECWVCEPGCSRLNSTFAWLNVAKYCGACGFKNPYKYVAPTCCGYGDGNPPGPNHELSCEKHQPLNLSPPTHATPTGESLCVGLIIPTELEKKGCPNCQTEDLEYCPSCHICTGCNMDNNGRGGDLLTS